MDDKKEINIENLKKKYIKQNEIKKDDKVPDQVLFGLIFGIIRGPLIKLPKTYAVVSLINEARIIK